jgi:3-oxoacid CoA-transferase A subunit
MINKVCQNLIGVFKNIKDRSKIMVGGFGLSGNPEYLIEALYLKNVKKITIIGNNCGTNCSGLGVLLKRKQVKRFVGSFIGGNSILTKQFITGQVEVELIPQGNLAEKIRCGGSGIPAFYSPVGLNTLIDIGIPIKYNLTGVVIKKSSPKDRKIFLENTYILEESIKADFALIKSYQSDSFGNLIFRKAARNFNPEMCTAAESVIVETENEVKIGDLDPDKIHTSGLYINHIVNNKNSRKLIENK